MHMAVSWSVLMQCALNVLRGSKQDIDDRCPTDMTFKHWMLRTARWRQHYTMIACAGLSKLPA
jgi:hypothetical protein